MSGTTAMLWRVAVLLLVVGFALRVLNFGASDWDEILSYTLLGLAIAAATAAVWHGGFAPLRNALRAHPPIAGAIALFVVVTIVAAITGCSVSPDAP